MILELQYPFNMWYRKGYLRESKDGRKRVDLRNSKTDSTTTSYARYLMCVKMGDLTSDEYDIDHINGDCSDDRIQKLQILLKDDHYAKTKSETTQKAIGQFCCGYCKKISNREVRSTHGRINLFCSRKCNAKYNRENNGWTGKTCL